MNSQSTNPQLTALISKLKKKSRETKTPLYRRLAEDLSKSKRSRRTVNLSKISRYSSDGSVVAVPGKVLSAGVLGHKVTVAAFKFSSQAKKKIVKAGGRCMSLEALTEENPAGTKVILLG
jgi:large subunit ribosomal protein L18e